jgi:mannonate dehydratase
VTQPIRIKDVKTILTQPGQARWAVIKVITSEPGLYGLGCATFTQRIHAVHAAIEKHLRPFLRGRDVSRIEETWHMSMVNGYWRNGPVLNNAISGVDQALWDIQGKLAHMPVYQLLGGKCREGAAVYVHADGRDPMEVEDNVRKFMAEGFRYVRVQLEGYGGRPARLVKPKGAPEGAYYSPREYTRSVLRMLEHVRSAIGEEVELLHDIHERLSPIEAAQFAKDVERFKLFFLEDPLAPEDLEWGGLTVQLQEAVSERMARWVVQHPEVHFNPV